MDEEEEEEEEEERYKDKMFSTSETMLNHLIILIIFI